MTDAPLTEPPAERFCHNCGAPNTTDYYFCVRCGARIDFLRSLPPGAGRLPGAYPVRFDVEYPQKLSRLSTLARLILAIPQLLIIYALGTVVSIVTLVAWFAILFTRRYPKGLFELVVGFNRWIAHVYAYTALLRDEYPPFTTDPGRYAVTYEVDYPERLSRWLIFVKWYLTLIHQLVLYVLEFFALIAQIIAWFAILITGRFPRSLFNYIVGVMRWNLRVSAYTSLMSDQFPPYSKRADAGPASGRAIALSAVFALPAWGLVIVAVVGIIVLVASFTSSTEEVTIRYADVLAGESSPPVDVEGNVVVLLGGDDPFDFPGVFREPRAGHRFVRFELEVTNIDSLFTSVSRETFELEDTRGREHDPLVVQGSTFAGELVEQGRTETVGVIFEVRNDADPAELTYAPGFRAFLPIGERVRFKFNGGGVRAPSRRADTSPPTVSAEFGEEVIVSYEDLLNGLPSRSVDINGMEVILRDARDPDEPGGSRSVRFDLVLTNVGAPPGRLSTGDFSLSDAQGVNYDPALVSLSESGQKNRSLESGESAQISVVFQLEPATEPVELSYTPDPATLLYTGEIVFFVFR